MAVGLLYPAHPNLRSWRARVQTWPRTASRDRENRSVDSKILCPFSSSVPCCFRLSGEPSAMLPETSSVFMLGKAIHALASHSDAAENEFLSFDFLRHWLGGAGSVIDPPRIPCGTSHNASSVLLSSRADGGRRRRKRDECFSVTARGRRLERASGWLHLRELMPHSH